jgi:hypothetical protein
MMEGRSDDVASHVIDPFRKVAVEREVDPPTKYKLDREIVTFSV